MSNFGLGILLNAKDMASGPIGLVANNFQGLVRAVKTGGPLIVAGIIAITAAVASLTVGLAGIKAAWDLAVQAGEFRKNMSALAGISRASAEEMTRLEGAAIDAGIATQFSPQEAASGLTSLAAAGQNAQASMETLIPVLDLAAGSLGQLGVQQAAEAVVGTLNSYGMAASNAANVTDRLLRITQLTNFQARDFEQGLARAAATGSQMGTSLNDTLITLGLMRNANIDAAVASTAFREATTRLTTHTQALNQLQRLNVDAFDSQTGAARSSLEIMMDVVDVLKDKTDRERQSAIVTIFGQRGMQAYNAVARAQREITENGTRSTLRGMDAIASYREELDRAGGTAAEFRDLYLSTFPGQLDLIRGTMETLKIVIGDTFGPIFRYPVKLVTDAVNLLIKGFRAMPKQMRIALGVIFLLTMSFMVLSGALTIAVVAAVALGTALGGLLVQVIAVAAGITLALAPVFVAMLGFMGLAALAYKAYQDNLGGLGDFVNGWAHRVKTLWLGLSQIFTQGFLSGEVRTELLQTENEGLLNFLGTLSDFIARVRAFWSGLTETVGTAWTQMGPTFRVLVETLQVLFEEIGRTFGESGPAREVTNFANRSIMGAEGMGASFGQTLVQGLQAAAQAMIIIVEAMIAIIDHYNEMKPFINSMISGWKAVGGAILWAGQAISDFVSWLSNPAVTRWIPIIGPLINMARSRGGQAITEGRADIARRRAEASQRAGAGIAYGVAAEARGEAVSAGRAKRSRLAEEEARRGGGPRTEASTERPATVEAGRGGDPEVRRTNDILLQLTRRGRGAPVELRTILEVDGARLAESVTRTEAGRRLLEGGLVPEATGR